MGGGVLQEQGSVDGRLFRARRLRSMGVSSNLIRIDAHWGNYLKVPDYSATNSSSIPLLDRDLLGF